MKYLELLRAAEAAKKTSNTTNRDTEKVKAMKSETFNTTQAQQNEKTQITDKVKRYGWTIKDAPGKFMIINKNELKVDDSYQREIKTSKVLSIASEWSWVGAGAISVVKRGNSYWAVDGNHRVEAAKKRGDITHLPCMVFECESIKEEAEAFLKSNINRKPVTALEKFKAMTVSGDNYAIMVNEVLNSLGITLKGTSAKAGEMKSISWALKKCKENPVKFVEVMELASKLCHDMPIPEILLGALWHLNNNIDGGLQNKKFVLRIEQTGARALIEGAKKAAAYFVQGGEKVWATGALNEINKNLRNKYVMKESEDK